MWMKSLRWLTALAATGLLCSWSLRPVECEEPAYASPMDLTLAPDLPPATGPDAATASPNAVTSNPRISSEVVPAVPRPLPTSTVMHAKLTSTQHLLAGLLSEDYELIAKAAGTLRELARDVPPRTIEDGLDGTVYEHFRLELLRLASDLQQMGRERNLNGAAYLHGNITATCIACHKRLRDSEPSIELLSPAADLLGGAQPSR